MRRWSDLLDTAPTVAEPIGARLAGAGLGILGTVRADGSPRVSPIEVMFVDGALYVGMMPGSAKLRDVEHDPRYALLTPVADRHDVGGEGKLFGVLARVTDPEAATAVIATAYGDTDVDPAALAGAPVLEVLAGAAAWQYVDGDTWVTRSWSERRGTRVRHRVGPLGVPFDVVEEERG